jgi:hypothetical protein
MPVIYRSRQLYHPNEDDRGTIEDLRPLLGVNSTMRILLWALPVTLSLHVAEEFWFPGGLGRWISLHNHRRVKSAAYYVFVNAAAILAAVAIALLARGRVGYWLYLYSVALMGGNSVSHLSAAFRQGKYCPGSVSGGVLLIPLLILSAWVFVTQSIVALPLMILAIAMGLIVGFYLFAVDVRPFASQSVGLPT